MIRDETFRISRRPYAVDLDSLRVRTIEPRPDAVHRIWIHQVTLDAVWFRRRRGVTVAVLGALWDSVGDPAPTSASEALQRHTDGRYGGAWVARWDGSSYVSETSQSPEVMAAHLAVLRPMLESYPAVPEGFDGWWYFT